jgi:hypothetical protein
MNNEIARSLIQSPKVLKLNVEGPSCFTNLILQRNTHAVGDPLQQHVASQNVVGLIDRIYTP